MDWRGWGNAIYYIKDPTEEMKILAVTNYGDAIRHIMNPTKEMKDAEL
jgi:hypothetical protein